MAKAHITFLSPQHGDDALHQRGTLLAKAPVTALIVVLLAAARRPSPLSVLSSSPQHGDHVVSLFPDALVIARIL